MATHVRQIGQFPTAFPWSLTADGETLLAVNVVTGDDGVIVALELGGEPEFREVLEDASLPALSPDGEWLAYAERGGGASRISIRPYPEVGRQAYPVAPGNHPAFSRDGSELYFVDGEALRAVSIEYEPVFRIDEPRDLFRGRYTFNVEGRAWDVHPDGRFLMLLDAAEDIAAPSSPERQRIHVVVNWIEELQRLLPAE